MNKDELLKIYSAYLPYQTKCYCMGEQDEDGKPIMFEINGFTHDLVEVLECNTTNITHFDYDEIFPILYDLSYLTKEIEHEGETFVPIEKLFGSALAISGYTVCQDFQYEDFAHLTYVKDGLKPFPFLFEHYQKLFEWHFNVFQLPEDQFINKATLTNK